jgi:hypothetical protein
VVADALGSSRDISFTPTKASVARRPCGRWNPADAAVDDPDDGTSPPTRAMA